MSEQKFLEAMINAHQVQTGIALAVGLGVAHYDYSSGLPMLVDHVEEIIRLLRTSNQIALSDLDKVLNVGPGVEIGITSRRWIQRGDYAQAVQLLGAQAVDVMRQVLVKT